MANTIAVEIVDADKHVYSGEGVSVTVSASQGEIGVLPGHTPFLSDLKPGHVIIKHANGDEDSLYINSGFVEVQPTHVTILADTAERATDLDYESVIAAQKRAQKELRDATVSAPDFRKAQQALAEASARLELINRLRK